MNVCEDFLNGRSRQAATCCWKVTFKIFFFKMQQEVFVEPLARSGCGCLLVASVSALMASFWPHFSFSSGHFLQKFLKPCVFFIVAFAAVAPFSPF